MKLYALKYQKLGFSVLPMSPDKKIPLIEFSDKPPLTEQQIDEIWDRYPNANIAVRTTNFFVIDIDKHEKSNGFKSLIKWGKLDLFTPTLQAKTPSGGKHLFYFKREDEPISQMIGLFDGVDVKAHQNNYVLVAPSASNKGQYEWDIEKSAPNLTMTTPKKELIQALKKEWYKEREYYSQGLQFLKRESNSRQRTQTTELFETIIKGLGEKGSRNAKLASFVGSLLTRGVDEETTLELAKITNYNTPSPLSNKEVETTVYSMIKKDRR